MSTNPRSVESLRLKEAKLMNLSQLVEHFVRHGQIAGKSDQTSHWYVRRLGAFESYLKKQGHSLRVTQLTLGDAERYIGFLLSKDTRWADHPYHKPDVGQRLSMTTIHGHVRSLRTLSRWAFDQGYLQTDVFQKLPVPKLPKRLYEILNEEEITRILEAADALSRPGFRLRTLFLLTLDTGIRAAECAGLRLPNVDLKAGTIKVFGKGGKERYIPIGQMTQKELLSYISFHRPTPAHPDHDQLFLSEDGVPLRYDALASMMRRLRERAGVKRLHMHKIRHTALTMMVERGTPSFAVQQFAGHSTISTTEGYVHLAQQRTAFQFQKSSVVDGLDIIKNASRRGRKRIVP